MKLLFLIKLYAFHLFYRCQRLWDLAFRRRSLASLQEDATSLLVSAYGDLPPELPYPEKLRQREFSLYSQNGEDGVVLFIFSQIGMTNKSLVEFGVETGQECIAANPLVNFGWNGLLMDGSSKNMRKGRRWYRSKKLPNIDDIQLKQCFVTTENINREIADSGIHGEIDLLSVDIDGNDYWVWDAIDVINPRVVVAEYNACFGASRSLTVDYDPAFSRFDHHPTGWYHGASLAALTNLADTKGYSLVGCESQGCNAFFVRKDLIQGELQELTPEEAFYPQPKRLRIAPQEKQFKVISHLPLVRV